MKKPDLYLWGYTVYSVLRLLVIICLVIFVISVLLGALINSIRFTLYFG